ILFRCLYAFSLLLALCWVYWEWQTQINAGRGEALDAATEMPRFAGRFFAACLLMQFAAVLLLTPIYAAGAIAEEKERRTLEFLLATDLSGREIVLGKFISRVANLALLVATTLPILGLTQLWGGVDPTLVLAGFVLTAATMLSLAGLSVLNSV